MQQPRRISKSLVNQTWLQTSNPFHPSHNASICRHKDTARLSIEPHRFNYHTTLHPASNKSWLRDPSIAWLKMEQPSHLGPTTHIGFSPINRSDNKSGTKRSKNPHSTPVLYHSSQSEHTHHTRSTYWTESDSESKHFITTAPAAFLWTLKTGNQMIDSIMRQAVW